MKQQLKSIFSLSFLLTVASCSDISDPEKIESEIYVSKWAEGTWHYPNSTGTEVAVTLYNDGSALSSDDAIGSWFFVEHDLYITWMNGWMDLIRSQGNHFEKFGFAPGVPVTSKPTNEHTAVKVKGS